MDEPTCLACHQDDDDDKKVKLLSRGQSGHWDYEVFVCPECHTFHTLTRDSILSIQFTKRF